MKRIVSALLPFFLFCCLALLTPCTGEAAEPARTVRIGFAAPIVQGNDYPYTLLLNYLRDYLDEVSKQTRWQYVYISAPYGECRNMLMRGELDFIAPVQLTPADSGMTPIDEISCYSLLRLYRRNDDTRRAVTAEAFNGTVIGLLENKDNEDAVSYFISRNGWHVNLRTFPDPASLREALYNGEIDTICDDGTHVTAAERYLLTFDVVPAHFMAAPGNEELNRTLSDTVLDIDTLSPGFETRLKEEYFDKTVQNVIRPTDTDRQFIENSGELRVAFLPDFPIFFRTADSLEASGGLYIDFLKLLSNVSGMRFSPCRAESEEQLWQMLESGEADLAFVSYANGRSPTTISFSGDFRNEDMAVVYRHDSPSDSEETKNTAAVPACFPGMKDFIESRSPLYVTVFATVEECLDAVSSGTCRTALIPSVYLQQENSLALRSDLEISGTEHLTLPISLAVSPRRPSLLRHVLNTSMLRLNPREIDRLVQENTLPRFSARYMLHRYPIRTAILFSLLIAGIFFLIFVLYRNRLQKQQNRLLQKKNEELENALERVEAMRISRDGYKLDSETDKNTGVYNKAGFERLTREAIEKMAGSGRQAALYIIDMDHFKEANDTYGHQCGDEILRNFAAGLRNAFRQSDCVGRFGGDEFMVFIEGTLTREVLSRKATQIREAARSIAVEGRSMDLTASVGISLFPENGTDYDTLFRAADEALYRAKTGGRDAYAYAGDPEGTVYR